MSSQLANSLIYTHDIKEQDLACPLSEQYPNYRKQMFVIFFVVENLPVNRKQMSL